MAGIIIVGAQFGDEGKGKIVDYLVETLNVEHVARYQGGNNAGHTVVVKGEKFKLHNIPSGVIHGKVCMLGNGMVIDPDVLLSEIKGLQARGIDPKLMISQLAHVITQKHKNLDGKDTKIGTTKRGIGPA
ncbi:TPA: adenylosuccinate synthetase, partial [archaeon]|nr:adenylosuccinate synthetase [Candidatus Naiadarchaeales archaeon SRR2090153.bin461]